MFFNNAPTAADTIERLFRERDFERAATQAGMSVSTMLELATRDGKSARYVANKLAEGQRRR